MTSPVELSSIPDKIYDSKRDNWLVGLLVIVIVVCIGSAVAILFMSAPLYVIALQVILFLGLAVFCTSILRSTNYTLTGKEIRIRSGPIRWTTSIDDIISVTPTRKAWSSAALSLDRLYIKTESLRSSSYISPEDKVGFMADLARRSPLLQFDGLQIRRTE